MDELRAEMKVRLRERMLSTEIVAAYVQTHPVEYEAFEKKALDGMFAPTPDIAATKALIADFSSKVHKSASEMGRKAPDAEVVAMARAQLSVMRFAAQTNYAVCYEYHENKGLKVETALTVGPLLRAEIEKSITVQARAIAAAERNPTQRARPSNEDGLNVIRAYKAAGGDQAWLTAMGSSSEAKLTPKERCEGALTWLEAIIAQPAPVAARVFQGS